MTPDAATPVCQLHSDRGGSPCPRCGTFRCEECLAPGLCPSCQGADVARPPLAEEVYGFGRRAGGRVIDMVAHQIIAIMTGVFAGVTIALLEKAGLARPGAVASLGKHGFLFNILSGNVAAFLAATSSTAICGATFGKAILGMRVVSVNGGKASFGGVVLRELGYFIDVFFFGMIGKAAMESSPLSQCHGDRWGNTTVVRSAAATGNGRSSTPAIIIGLLTSAIAYGLSLGGFFVASAL